MDNEEQVSLGGVFLDKKISNCYLECRAPDSALRAHYDRQVAAVSDMTKRSVMNGNGTVTMPILVWQPDCSEKKYAIVAPIELWNGLYLHTVPSKTEYHNGLIDPAKIKWENVNLVEGDEKEIRALISSFPPITQPLKMTEIIQNHGLKKIDLYSVNDDESESKPVNSPPPSLVADAPVTGNVPKVPQKQDAQAQPRQTPTLASLVMLEELEHLFPPLDEEAYKMLKQDILEFKECLQPIVIWRSRNTVVDGHNRIRACLEIKRERGIEIQYRILPVEFQDISDAIVWMIRNQVHRRSLSEFDRCQMILRYREEITKKNNEKKKLNLRQYQNQPIPPADTPDVPAEKHISCKSEEKQEPLEDKPNIFEGIPEPSREKLRKVRKIQECGSESIIKDARNGKMTINAAFNKVQEELKAAEGPQQEDESAEKSTQPEQTWERLKLKIGKELIPTMGRVKTFRSIIVLKIENDVFELEKMLQQKGFETEDCQFLDNLILKVMYDKSYYETSVSDKADIPQEVSVEKNSM